MNLTSLKYIVSLAREKHFGRAAKACGVAQPTLSVAIKNLEEELGIQLFERTPMDVRVTSTGLTVVRHAMAVLQDIHAIEEVARNSQNPNVGVLRLGVVHHLNPRLMPHLMQRIRTALETGAFAQFRREFHARYLGSDAPEDEDK